MIKSKKHLSRLLGLPFERLEAISNSIDKYYYEKKEPKVNKNGIPRLLNGEPVYRIINPSRGILKQIQKSISKRILSKINLPNNIQGGRKGKDNISNAKLHKGKKFHFVTDLVDFFPSISNRLVYAMFIENQFSPDVAHILTRLTTYNGKVPQGAPTSTAIANLVFSKVDKILIEICYQNEILYTRFVDDLSFSSIKDFEPLVNTIIKSIRKGGFKISRKKTHYKIGPVDITGINVRNNCLRPTKEFKDKQSTQTLSDAGKAGRKRYITRIYKEGEKATKANRSV